MKNRPFAWGRAPADFFDIVHKFQTEFLARQTPGGPIGLPGVLFAGEGTLRSYGYLMVMLALLLLEGCPDQKLISSLIFTVESLLF